MAELVDALVSEASEETHGGSSPLGHTILIAKSMEHDAKEKNVYKGIWIAFLVLIAVPVAFFFLFYNVLKSNYEGQQIDNLIYASLTFSCTVGFLFCLILIFTGLIKELEIFE